MARKKGQRRRAEKPRPWIPGELARSTPKPTILTDDDIALFEAVWRHLRLHEHSCLADCVDLAAIDQRLSTHQREEFVSWNLRKKIQIRQHRTRPAATMDAIQKTNFTSHSSRCNLIRIISEASSSLDGYNDRVIPLGSQNGHRFGLRPSLSLERAEGDSTFPNPSWKEDDLRICDYLFGVSKHTYSQLWCLPPETGLPQTRYGRCSGNGLLGSVLSPPSFRQPSTSPDPSSPQNPAGTALDSFAAAIDIASSRHPVSEVSSSSAATSYSASSLFAAGERSGSSPATSFVDTDSHAPINHAFLPLGRIHVETTSDSDRRPRWQRWAKTAHFAAVDTSDQSVWMFYQAWYKDEELWEYDGYDLDYEIPSYGRFRPEREPDWARLEGYDSRRRVMAKLADDVRSWQLGSFDTPLVMGDNVLPDEMLPVFIYVGLDQDDNLVVPH